MSAHADRDGTEPPLEPYRCPRCKALSYHGMDGRRLCIRCGWEEEPPTVAHAGGRPMSDHCEGHGGPGRWYCCQHPDAGWPCHEASDRDAGHIPSDGLLDSAWVHYLNGTPLTKAEAAEVWRQLHALYDIDERTARVLTLGRHVDREATRGKRCSVCAGIEGNHDDC